MSLPTSEEAKPPATPATPIAQQETTSTVGEETISSAFPKFLGDQQQTVEPSSAIKESTASLFQEVLIHHPQSSGPPSSVEDQLRKQITGLEDEIRQFKLEQEPSRGLVKHTLLQEELAQLREKNLNLRVDLQLAHEKHQALESEHHKYKKQMKRFLEKAMKNLSTGLDLSKGGSADPGLTTEGVVAGASLAPQQSISNTIVEKIGGTPSAFQFGAIGSTGASLPVQPNIFGQPPATGASPSFLGPLGSNNPFPSMFGDPKETIQQEAHTKFLLISTPGFCNNQEQSFEEARLRRYVLHNDRNVPSWTPNWPDICRSLKAPAPHGPVGGASSSKGFFQKGKKGKNRTEGGRRERQTPGSIDTADAISWDFSKPAKPEGDGTANMTPADNNTGKD